MEEQDWLDSLVQEFEQALNEGWVHFAVVGVFNYKESQQIGDAFGIGATFFYGYTADETEDVPWTEMEEIEGIETLWCFTDAEVAIGLPDEIYNQIKWFYMPEYEEYER